jgi:metal transporter CNNM
MSTFWHNPALIWAGIALCITQTGILSGLNVAIFSISRMRLEIEAANGNSDAVRMLQLRHNANFTLTTILWGNISINVLLTLLSDQVLAGIGSFLFSTFAITLLGEIIPQAWFSRRALRITSALKPLIRFYGVLLYVVAKPSALLLDWWLGPEAISFFRERDVRALIMKHAEAGGEVGKLEATGALNFLDLDDIGVAQEGEPVDPRSVIALPTGTDGKPQLPQFQPSAADPFLRQINLSHKKWIVITNPAGEPKAVLNAHQFLRNVLFDGAQARPQNHLHRPILVTEMQTKLGDVIGRMKVCVSHAGDDVIDHDLILVWGRQCKRIITGADLLGRLLRGIAEQQRAPVAAAPTPVAAQAR